MKILLVEDDDYFADLIQIIFEDIDIQRVRTLEEACEYLDSHCVKMIMLDLGLPDSLGIDTLKSLSKYQIPKIIVTSTHDNGEASKFGIMDYIVKDGDIFEIGCRIKFNIDKLSRRSCMLNISVFQEIKACLEQARFIPNLG